MASNFLRDVGIAVTSAGALGFSVYKLRLPLLLGYLVAGVALGPHLGFGVIESQETITILAEIGLVFLMYILGMEIDVRKLLTAGKAVFVNGVTQFLGCCALSFGVFSLLGFGGRFTPVYLAVAASLSSTLIVVKLLSERMELDTLSSRITLGILVLQDVWAIAFLAAQPNLSNFHLGLLLLSLLRAGLLVGVAAVLAKYFLPYVFKKIAVQAELTLIVAMGWCFLIAGVASFLGLSLEMGALIAGVSIASFPYHVQIAVKISSLRDFFVTLFFVALGLQIPVPTAEVLRMSLAIVGFTLISRVLTVYPVLYLMKHGNRGSLVPGINLSQVSEFSLVILSLGVSYGHISSDLLSAFIIALVFTALLSSLLIPRSHQIYRGLNPLLEKLGLRDRIDFEDASGGSKESGAKIVFLGFYREASSLLHEIERRPGAPGLSEILVVDINPETIGKLKAKGLAVHYADIGHSDTLGHLELADARVVISTIPDSVLRGTSNLKLLRTVKELAPRAKILLTAETSSGAEVLYQNGADYVCLPRLLGAKAIADVLERIESGDDRNFAFEFTRSLKERREVLD